jgi:hypothetical protein
MGNTEATANNVYDLFKPKAGGTGRFISITEPAVLSGRVDNSIGDSVWC